MKIKRIVVFLHDLLWVPLSIWLAYWFRFNLGPIPDAFHLGALQLLAVALPCHALTFWLMGCYRGIWRFASLSDVIRILKAIALGVVGSSALLFVYDRFAGVPRSAIVLYPMFLMVGVVSARVGYRLLQTHRLVLDAKQREPALIIGAGRAGNLLIRDLLDHGPFVPVGILDDDPVKRGTELHGVRVLGGLEGLDSALKENDVSTVLVAMPSAPRSVMDKIVRQSAEAGVKCRTLPSLLELADGRVEVARLRPVTVEDLLGRDPVSLDETAINAYLSGKVVLITGGGGSIGSELCRQVLVHQPAKLIIVESSEFNLYRIERELQAVAGECQVVPRLADVRIADLMESLFKQEKPEVVFHAAAYKHVPMVEANVLEGVRNNILGTKLVADVAVEHGVSTFVLVSTDKTVNPTNVMGATKRVAEIYCQALNERCDTHFVTTRFGNVLGSAGSVVPLFEKQIQSGGPVTVTHADITRFFMTIPEAASLILQAGSMGKGGEIYVLDMGKPVKIDDLARNLIRLSGLQPDLDIRIEYVGLRPGEKMHEELFYAKEELCGTDHPKLLLANSHLNAWDKVSAGLGKLALAVQSSNEEAALGAISELVPEFSRYVPGNSPEGTSGPGLRVVR